MSWRGSVVPEIVTACLAYRQGRMSREERVEALDRVLTEVQRNGNEALLVYGLGYFAAVLLVYLAEETGQQPETLLQNIAREFAVEGSDDEG